MLDIKFIKENAELVKMAAVKKRILVDIDRLLVLDEERRAKMTAIETKKAEQNRVSTEIADQAQNPAVRNSLIEKMQALKAEIVATEESLRPIMEEWQALMLQVPNIPDMSVPDGQSDADNL